LFGAGLLTLPFRLKADAIDRRIHLGNTKDLSDSLTKRHPLAQIDSLTSEASRLRKALRNQVADNDHGRTQ
jgi:hypothetical protein